MPEPDDKLTMEPPQKDDCVAVAVTGGVAVALGAPEVVGVVDTLAVPLGEAVADADAPGDSVADADAVIDAVAVPVAAMLAVAVPVADGVGLKMLGDGVTDGVGGTYVHSMPDVYAVVPPFHRAMVTYMKRCVAVVVTCDWVTLPLGQPPSAAATQPYARASVGQPVPT